jgi:hypothetical protein
MARAVPVASASRCQPIPSQACASASLPACESLAAPSYAVVVAYRVRGMGAGFSGHFPPSREASTGNQRKNPVRHPGRDYVRLRRHSTKTRLCNVIRRIRTVTGKLRRAPRAGAWFDYLSGSPVPRLPADRCMAPKTRNVPRAAPHARPEASAIPDE